MAFDGIDAETLAVIIELQLSDLGSLIKGKGKEGDETPDGEIAMSAYKEELDCLECFRADRALCQSIARAVELDGDTIASHVDIKEQAADDRQQALDTDQYVDDTLDTDPDQPNTNNNPSTIAEAMAVDHDDEDTVAESSAWAASRPGTSPSHGEVECVACCEMVPSSRIVRCPCSHEYCLDCVAQVFRGSIADESLFPPRCCKLPIPIGPNQGHLPEDVVTAFKTKAVEYNTQNRTYCHQMACSKFIHEASIDGDTATCQGCLSRTCTICKGPSHSDECPADTATQEVLRIAADNGWKRCHKCQRVVELDVGCNHMVCRCGAQFCYSCSEPWKSCRCDQWVEERLISRANAIVNRNNANEALSKARRKKLVSREKYNQRANHECAHENWGGRRGKHQCEECHDTSLEYIYECGQCHVLVCRQCRFNRL